MLAKSLILSELAEKKPSTGVLLDSVEILEAVLSDGCFLAKAYSEPCQTSKMDCFAEIVNV